MLKKKGSKKRGQKKSKSASSKTAGRKKHLDSKVSPRIPRLIAVVHLPPLPGAPGADASVTANQWLDQIGTHAISEAKALEAAGFDTLIIENFGDAPFFKSEVGHETLACMTILASAIQASVGIPVGINILRNAAHQALAVAAVTGAPFIRVNVLSGVAATDQGIIEGQAATLLRERARLNTPVGILADVHVKHAVSLSSKSLKLGIEEVMGRGGADGVILTGKTTGRAVDLDLLKKISVYCKNRKIPLFVGSGVTAKTVAKTLKFATGVIVGSDLRQKGRAGAPLDQKRITAFIKSAQVRA